MLHLVLFACRVSSAAILNRQKKNIFLKLVSFITYVMSGLKELLKGQGGCLEDMSVFEIGIASDLSESTDTNITVK